MNFQMLWKPELVMINRRDFSDCSIWRFSLACLFTPVKEYIQRKNDPEKY